MLLLTLSVALWFMAPAMAGVGHVSKVITPSELKDLPKPVLTGCGAYVPETGEWFCDFGDCTWTGEFCFKCSMGTCPAKPYLALTQIQYEKVCRIDTFLYKGCCELFMSYCSEACTE